MISKLIIVLGFFLSIQTLASINYNLKIEQFEFRGEQPLGFEVNLVQQGLFRYLKNKYQCKSIKFCTKSITPQKQTLFSYQPGRLVADISAICKKQPPQLRVHVSGIFDIGEGVEAQIKNTETQTYDTLILSTNYVRVPEQISYYYKIDQQGCDISALDETLEYQLIENTTPWLSFD